MRVFFDPKDRHLMVRRIEFDNLEHKNNLAVQFAEWGYEKPIDPLDVHTIRYQSVNKGFAKDAFSTAPPKGLRLTDMRAKKSPTPRAGNLRVPDSVSP
jgi:hypothetical protein